MFRLGDWFWRPRHVFPSAEAWARHSGQRSCLQALPVPDGTLPESDPGRWWVAALPQGKVVGDLRLVATSDNTVLGQLQSLHGIAEPAAHWTTRQRRVRKPAHLRGTAVILASASGANYYHWLLDSLPRLRLLQWANIPWDTIDAFLVNEPECPFVVQTLELLGIPRSRVVRCSKRQILTADLLLVPPLPTPLEGGVAPWACEFLRQALGPTPNAAAAQSDLRLYLSRRNSPRRRLANEEAVEALVLRHGFQIVRPEELSFPEQALLFSQATAVVGPHGAGFANIVFASPGARILELFHPQHRAANYESISRILGLNYRRIIGEARFEEGRDYSDDLGPYSISLEQLDAELGGPIRPAPVVP